VIVVDASALIDVVLGQPAAGWVLDRLAGEDLCAPCHLPAEVASATARLVRAGELESAAAGRAVDRLLDVAVEMVLPTAAHLRRALALQERIRVHDGLYVALAEERGCALVTTDRRLSRADAPCQVVAPG